MFSCYYQPTLTEPDLFPSGALNFLIRPDIIIAAKQNVFIKKYAIADHFVIFCHYSLCTTKNSRSCNNSGWFTAAGVTIIIKGTKIGTAANGDGSLSSMD